LTIGTGKTPVPVKRKRMVPAMSKINEVSEFFGEVISYYTRKQALEDGVAFKL
jgi:hypothetical protein